MGGGGGAAADGELTRAAGGQEYQSLLGLIRLQLLRLGSERQYMLQLETSATMGYFGSEEAR